MSIVSKRRNIFTTATSSGGSGVQSVNSGTDITVDNTDPANPIINFTGTYQDPITVVANYSALPTASTVTGEFYWCSASQGTAWLPGSLGGTYYSAGLYYSNGTSWEFMAVPYQATQAEVNTGTNSDKFVTPNTLFNSSKWSNFVPYTGAASDVDLGIRILSAQSLQVTGTNGAGHIHLRHQASDATATGQTTALFANSNGDLKYKNDGNYYTTFATSANTANRVYTFPNADGTIALTSNLSSYVPTSRTLTINGTAFDLSADRSWTVSSGITVGTTTITSGTSGRVAFNNAGVYGESSNLFWDNTNNRQGILTSTPTSSLQIGGTTAVSGSTLLNWGNWDINIGSSPSLTSGNKTALLLGRKSDSNGDAYIQTATTGTDYGRLFLQNFSVAGSLPTLKGVVIVGDGSDGSNAAKLNVTNGPILVPPVLGSNPNTGGSTYSNGMCYALINPTYPSGIGLDGSYAMWFQSAPTIGTGFKWYHSNTQLMTLTSSGNLGIQTTPTAKLHLAAGTATANTAPLKLTAGTNLTTPENGAFEFDGTNLYFTVGGVRKTVTLI